MPNDEAIKNIKELLKWYLKEEPMSETVYKREAVEMAIKALEQRPCEDAVSRQDVLDLAKRGVLISNGSYESVCKAINELPPVTPQRPKGKWIEYEVDIAPHPLHCSLCGFSNHHISNRYIMEFRRCPNCGAEMSGGEEDDIKT